MKVRSTFLTVCLASLASAACIVATPVTHASDATAAERDRALIHTSALLGIGAHLRDLQPPPGGMPERRMPAPTSRT